MSKISTKNILKKIFKSKPEKKVKKKVTATKVVKEKKLTKNKNIVRVTPLPPIEIRKGPIVICPPNKIVKNLFKHLGEVIEIRNEKLSYKFWSTASIMAAFYEILNVSSNWLIKKGIKKNIANKYIVELFLSLSKDAEKKRTQGFKKLVKDSQTPKGLNMQVLKELQKGKFYNKILKSLDNVNKRVSK